MSPSCWFVCGLAAGFGAALLLVGFVLSVVWNDITRIVRYER